MSWKVKGFLVAFSQINRQIVSSAAYLVSSTTRCLKPSAMVKLLLAHPVPKLCNPRIANNPKNSSLYKQIGQKTHLNYPAKNRALSSDEQADENGNKHGEHFLPSMADILAASRAQQLDLHLKTLGPFFRITARNLETGAELGTADGLIRVWFGGRILHLDSIKLRRETLAMERSIFGIGLFLGAVAIRHGYDCGCRKAELLAINDTDLYHSKLVRFYRRIGFEVVHEVTGSTMGDMAHMLVWGGIGTRMDAGLHKLLIKWCSRFKLS